MYGFAFVFLGRGKFRQLYFIEQKKTEMNDLLYNI